MSYRTNWRFRKSHPAIAYLHSTGYKAALTAAGMLVLMLPALSAKAKTLDVPSSYATIDAAISAAGNGDTILVDDGTYSASGDLNLNISKSLTIQSVNGAASTIINCSSSTFISQATAQITVRGFTIRNSTSPFSVIEIYAPGTIDSCVFKNNHLANFESFSLIFSNIFSGTLTVSNCTFDSNSAYSMVEPGGQGASLDLSNSTFTNNTGQSGGSGAVNSNSASGTISNCLFSGNTSATNAYAGAVYWINGSLSVTDSVFIDNRSPNAGGGALFVGASGIATPVTLTRCLFKGNSAPTGGAIILSESNKSASLTANDCLFIGNGASNDGAAIGVISGITNTIIALNNCSFYGNKYTGGSASGKGTISASNSVPLTLNNTILYGDLTSKEISTSNPPSSTTATNSDIHQAGFAFPNIDADPQYNDPVNDDLHLQPSSPCAGTGTTSGAPATDYSMYAWGNTLSMGAYSPVHFDFVTPASIMWGTPFTYTVTARAADDSTIITNYSGTVHFDSTDAAAALPADTTLTNGTGTFSATLNSSGDQMISATDTAISAITGVSSAITAVNPVSQLLVNLPSGATAGVPLSVTVTAADSSGTTVTGYNGIVHFTSDDPTATLPADTALTNGAGTFQATLTRATIIHIRARDTGNTGITGLGSTVVAPSSVTHLTITAPADTNTGFANIITVAARDQYENVVSAFNDTVHFTSTDAGALLPADTVLTGGYKPFAVKYATPGVQSVTVTDLANNSLTANGTSTVGLIASKFRITTPATVIAGAPFNATVTAVDNYGNTVTGYSGSVHFISADPSATLPADTTLTNGTGTFQITLTRATTQSITAADTAASMPRGSSPAFKVQAAGAASLSITVPASATKGVPCPVTVTAKDAYGNIALSDTDTIHVISSDSKAVLPANAPLVAGTRAFKVKFYSPGSRIIKAMDIANSQSVTSATIAVK